MIYCLSLILFELFYPEIPLWPMKSYANPNKAQTHPVTPPGFILQPCKAFGFSLLHSYDPEVFLVDEHVSYLQVNEL